MVNAVSGTQNNERDSPIVFPDNVLFILTALNDLFRASLQLGTDLTNQRHNEWGNDREAEHRELLFELFNNLGKNGDLLKRRRDALTHG